MRAVLVLGVVLAATAARADDPSYCRDHWDATRGCLRRHEHPWRPMATFGIEGGVGHFDEGGPGKFNDGFGAATGAGGTWGARVGIDFFQWLGLEARYMGAWNRVHEDVADQLGYLTSAGIFDVRLSAPIPFVHPYVFSGIGVYTMDVHGPQSSKTASGFVSSTQPGVPIGVGLDVPINWHFSIAVEATYHFQFGETFSKSTVNGVDGGDFSTATGLFRVRL